jgi:hypothetical protein
MFFSQNTPKLTYIFYLSKLLIKKNNDKFSKIFFDENQTKKKDFDE